MVRKVQIQIDQRDPNHGSRPPRQEELPENTHLCFDRLFDPHNYDHTTLEQYCDAFPKKNLRQTRLYNFAERIFGKPRTRRRVIVAPPMEKLRRDQDKTAPARHDHDHNSQTQPQKPSQPLADEAVVAAKKQQEEIDEYRSWLAERKVLRGALDGMGVNEEWLAKKPHKTALEKSVLRKMVHERTYKPPPTPPVSPPPKQGRIGNIPIVERPSPVALQRLDAYVSAYRIRLLDLFTQLDKDKNWLVSKGDFRKAVKSAKLPDTSDELLEDLILTLDANEDDLLNYRDLARGMESWRIEKRGHRRREMAGSRASTATSRGSAGLYEPSWAGNTMSDADVSRAASAVTPGAGRASADRATPGPTPGPTPRVKSRSSSSSLLEPPAPDLRKEQLILGSEEQMVDVRKQTREALKYYERERRAKSGRSRSAGLPATPSLPEEEEEEDLGPYSVISARDPAVDAHCTPSSFAGPSGRAVDKFRQARLREYYAVRRHCEENDVALTPQLLERVLLYPADKTAKQTKKKIRQPGGNLLSEHFADPPRKPRTPVEEKKMRKGTLKKSRGGKLMIDHRHLFPKQEKVDPLPQKMELSSGRAYVSRKVNCYMTFEEYDELTKHLATRYTQLNGNGPKATAFWPGYMLDKIRLCLPPYGEGADPTFHDTAGGSHVFFRSTVGPGKVGNPGFHHRHTWATNDAGYIQRGDYNPALGKHPAPAINSSALYSDSRYDVKPNAQAV